MIYFRFNEKQLSNKKYRYTGYICGIAYCVDSLIKKTDTDIRTFLSIKSIDYLLEMEGYVISMD